MTDTIYDQIEIAAKLAEVAKNHIELMDSKSSDIGTLTRRTSGFILPANRYSLNSKGEIVRPAQ